MLSGELCFRRQNMQSSREVSLDKTAALKICESAGHITSDSLIPILQQIQDAYGYLPAEILAEVSKHTGLHANQMYGVATFYEQFHLEPRGRHTIKCCRGTACHVKGGREIVKAVEHEIGIEEGQTTEDMRFTFETVACLGTCFLAPAVMINNDYYGQATRDKIKAVLKKYT
jgi:NADH:ubiquinone oxidoreductase subunit E